MKVRTRFAPSPTGFLHVGGVRTALFNYLFAKQQGGEFLLRLEDTDRERFVSEGVEQVVEALDWLGLKPDEGFWISEGKHQNVEYIQSERQKTGLYKNYADQLIAKGLAYYSPTTSDELNDLREQARNKKKPFIYKKELDKKNTHTKINDAPVRFDIDAFTRKFNVESRNVKKKDGSLYVVWSDKSHNTFGFFGDDIDDFILIKSDGFPTYNFANVIDDYEMKISHVLRGTEFISSTPKHILLYHALDIQLSQPIFTHLPVINGTDGKKLSKRTGDTNTLDYRDKGYLPEAMLNFLALLGWNDGTEQEIFSIDELCRNFSLRRIHSSPAVFDSRRLDWMNGYHVRQKPLDELFKLVSGESRSFWPEEAEGHPEKYKKQVLGLVQERLKYFAELPDLTRFFFTDLPVDPELISNHKQLKKLQNEDLLTYLNAAKTELEQSDFTASDLTKRLNGLLYLTHSKPVILFSLIRIATTQAPASPGLAETLAVLGKRTVMRRLLIQLEALE